jgi:3-deoxy-7-phosphoheptulonate synthase
MIARTENIHIDGPLIPLVPPRVVKEAIPLPDAVEEQILRQRRDIVNILNGDDPRMLIIAGPCSVHNVTATLEYCEWLMEMRERFLDRLYIMVRLHQEKPRTTKDWPGMFLDPSGTEDGEMDKGIAMSRGLFVEAARIGLPVSTELMLMFGPQYYGDVLSFAVLGARTSESSIHRWLVSGVSAPYGIKNGTGGSIKQAVYGLETARHPHWFPGNNEDGILCKCHSTGNPNGVLILRGGAGEPNYEQRDVDRATRLLSKTGLRPVVMIDVCHDNSGKNPQQSEQVWHSVIKSRAERRSPVIGMMLESYFQEGRQNVNGKALSQTDPKISITDPCVSIKTTERLLTSAHHFLTCCDINGFAEQVDCDWAPNPHPFNQLGF